MRKLRGFDNGTHRIVSYRNNCHMIPIPDVYCSHLLLDQSELVAKMEAEENWGLGPWPWRDRAFIHRHSPAVSDG